MLIRNKLILRFTLLVLAIQLSFSAFVYYFHAAAREQRFTRRLAGKAIMTARLHLSHPADSSRSARAFRRADLLTIEQEEISIYGPDNRLLYVSADTVPQAANRQQLAQVASASAPVRFRVGPLDAVGLSYGPAGQAYRLFAAGYDELGWAQLANLRLILLAGNVGALLLIILAGWYFADESLKPIAKIINQVQKITARELSRRVDEGNGTDEIAQLAITFNHMLGGVEQAFEAQKSFVSHASHELRTPLTVALGTLQTGHAYDQTLVEAQASMASAVDDLRQLVALTNALLTLAQADQARFRGEETVRLDECLTQALAQCQSRYPGRQVRVAFGSVPARLDTPFAVVGNAQLLTTALLNLLDNACKYSRAEVRATIGYPEPGTVAVAVADTGIGIEPTELARVTEPLYRAENGRGEPGYGIGLAVTQKIAQRHGGELQLASAAGAGTTATLRLPAA
jgi:signal transduction histidine kinase